MRLSNLWLLLFWLPAAVHAHKPSDSYLTLDLTQRPALVQWDIALRDLEYAVGIDRDGDGALTWGEVRAQHAAIASYALDRLVLRAADRDCVLNPAGQWLADHSDGTYTRLKATATCAASPTHLRYDLLFEDDPSHRGILRVIAANGEQTQVLSPARPTWAMRPAHRSLGTTFVDFWREGVWHIWIGLDHILFLLTLLLPAAMPNSRFNADRRATLGSVVRRTAWTVTGFTLGHSVTLALAAFGVLELPAALVEPAIAATLVLAAVNNLRPIVPGPTWAIASVLGLIHGLGFAAVLGDIGLPTDARLTALVGFNLGVETGQLVIVALVLPLINLSRSSPFYRRALVPAASLSVAVTGLFWLVERSLPVLGIGI